MRDEALLQGWFWVEAVAPDLFLIEEPLHDEQVKSYLLIGERRALLIDAGTGAGDLPALIKTLTDRPLMLVLSHAHWDHIGHAAALADEGAEVLISAEQAAALVAGVDNAKMRQCFAPERLTGPLPAGCDPATARIRPVDGAGRLDDGMVFDLGGWSLEVIMVPGHTPGLATLFDRERGILFSTDAAYAGDLYAQFEDSSLDDYLAGLERLVALDPPPRRLYPSHGVAPIGPELLPAMRDGVRAILAGRAADRREGGVAMHRFAGFAILVADAG